MSAETKKTHLLYLHLLRILGAIVVVFIHTSAPLLYEINHVSLGDWLNTNIINAFSRWAVPIFVMVSGTLLLDQKRDEQFLPFLKKRFSKIGIPFIFWFFIYLVWLYKSNVLTGLQPVVLLNHFLYELPHFHLYFLYIILFLYLCTPALRKLVHTLSSEQQLFFVTLLLMYTVTWKIRTFALILWLPFISYFVFPVVKQNMKSYFSAIRSISLFILASLAVAGGTYYRFTTNHSSPTYFYDYTNPLVVVQSISLFMFFYSLEPWFEKHLRSHEKHITFLSNATFGVYLIAPLIQDIVWDIFKMTIQQLQYSAFIVDLHAVLTLIISFLLICIMQKIPYIKRTV